MAVAGLQMPGMEKVARIGETTKTDAVGAARLRSFIERVERLEEEKAGIAADIKDIYSEAKGTGYDTKAMRKLISLRRLEIEQRREQSEILELYMHALGMED